MKILHTADWHIGRKLNGLDLLSEQKYVLDQLIDSVIEEEPDVIVIAGDLFDRSNPSKEALELVNQYLYKLNIELKKPAFVISGNHDSKERLNYGSAWFKESGLYISTSIEAALKPIKHEGHHFYLLPHVDVLEVRHYFDDDSIKSHQDAYSRIMDEIKLNLDPDMVNILVGHLFVSNAEASDSERPLSIGLSEEVNKETFQMFDYVMLGHLHHPFAVTDERIFYSGSLLKYSFSEINQPKGYRLIDTKRQEVKFKRLYPMHDLVYYEGDFNKVIEKDIMFDDVNAYFKFELKNMLHIKEPMSKIKQIYPNTLELRPKVTGSDREIQTIDVSATNDFEIFQSFIQEITESDSSEYQNEVFKNMFKGELDETH